MELNKVLLIGNLVADPNYRNTSTGKAVADFRLAVSRRTGTDRETGEAQQETAFVDIAVWEKSADFARNYLHKGSRIMVEGRLKQDNWQDKESGQNRSKLSVVADRIQFAESKAEAEARGAGRSSSGYDDDGGSGPRPATVRGEPAQRGDYGGAPQTRESQPAGGGGGTEDDLPF